MIIDTPRRGGLQITGGPPPARLVRALGKLSSFALGNDRIDQCTRWITTSG